MRGVSKWTSSSPPPETWQLRYKFSKLKSLSNAVFGVFINSSSLVFREISHQPNAGDLSIYKYIHQFKKYMYINNHKHIYTYIYMSRSHLTRRRI